MNKKIILSLGSAVLLASSLYAVNVTSNTTQKCGASKTNATCNKTQKCDSSKKYSKKMMNSKKMSKHQKKRHGKNKFMTAVKQLDLTKEQRQSMRSLMKENMKNRVNPNDAFTADGFDKALFMKLSKQKRESRLENKANMIESVYKLLTDSQKQELKKILDKKPMMKRMANKTAR